VATVKVMSVIKNDRIEDRVYNPSLSPSNVGKIFSMVCHVLISDKNFACLSLS
jgi:hypothetical protein